MAPNADNVRVGVTGAIYFADIGSELPIDAKTALTEDFIDVGYISEDGVTQTIDSSTEDLRAWQEGTVVRTVQTEHTYSLAFAMIETTITNLALYYADPEASETRVKVTGKQSEQHAVVADVLDGKHKIRVVIPRGQITEREEVTYKTDEAIAFGVTLATFPDDKGIKAYIYYEKLADPAKATVALSNKTPVPGEKTAVTTTLKKGR